MTGFFVFSIVVHPRRTDVHFGATKYEIKNGMFVLFLWLVSIRLW